MMIGFLFTLASAAQAAQAPQIAMPPVRCHTNVNQDPRQVTTFITLRNVHPDQADVVFQTVGGMAHFQTAPRFFNVTAQSRGPEMVEYFNSKEDFELTVLYQSINGQIHGTYTGLLFGSRVQTPVVCSIALK